MKDEEKLHRARVVMMRALAALAEVALDVETDVDPERKLRVMREFAPLLGEYAGMLEDATSGIEPFAPRSRTKKIRKVFGFFK